MTKQAFAGCFGTEVNPQLISSFLGREIIKIKKDYFQDRIAG